MQHNTVTPSHNNNTHNAQRSTKQYKRLLVLWATRISLALARVCGVFRPTLPVKVDGQTAVVFARGC